MEQLERRERWERRDDGCRWRRGSLLPGVADDRVAAEVSALVVRLEPRAVALRKQGLRVSRLAGRPLSLYGRAAVRLPRVSVSRREARPEPVASARQVVPRDSALHRADLPRS